ncbi:MAG: hypothetical protein CL774_02305 [Chloroflexi bacterium]|nr:hypothetical protein [Chloroflexota bacterium]
MINKILHIFKGSKKNLNDWEVLFTLDKAYKELYRRGEISAARKAGVIYHPDDKNIFLLNLKKELNTVLYTGEGSTKTSFNILDDSHSTKWIVLEDGQFYDLLSSVFTVGNAINSNGGGENIIGLVFEFFFTDKQKSQENIETTKVYLIYRYDLKTFYPFVPTGDAKGERNRIIENRLGYALKNYGIIIEPSLEKWLGLWGIPF